VAKKPLHDDSPRVTKSLSSVSNRSAGVAVQAAPRSPGKSTARKAVRGRPPSIADLAMDTPEGMNEAWRLLRELPAESPQRQQLRNRIMERYKDVVRATAERMRKRLPPEVDVDDLASAGLFGLMDAIDAFDLARNVRFETYCAQRIRGAIFDELRAMDWVPRLVRSRTATMERVKKAIEMEHGKKPTESEVAERMKISPEEFQKISRDSRPVGIVSINRKFNDKDSGGEAREMDVAGDRRQEMPTDRIQRIDVQALLTKGLSRSERLILILYYYEEMTMKEIGLTLDLSESRVSQMHSSILARLKAQMKHRVKDL
jgi:RNA polymerase sigma factor for flagellar operon FliA